MSNTTYAYFKTINHTGQESVSSYALPFCNYHFVLDLDAIEAEGVLSNNQVVWVYGDGTTGISLTGSHAYSEPGSYQVYCYLYDNEGNAYLNTYSRNMIIENFLTDQISLSVSNLSSYALTAGRIETPILVSRTNSYQSYEDDLVYSIVPYASGVDVSQNYFVTLSSELYGHLEKYSSFYTEETTRAGSTELLEVKEIITPQTEIYCKLVNGEVIQVDSTEENSFFCGTSGQELVYYKDDVSSASPVNLYFGFNTDIFDVNTSTVGLSGTVTPNVDYNALSITSNGIDGEGTQLSTFEITTDKFVNQNIHFVAKIKDADWFTVKDVDILDYSTTLYAAATSLTSALTSIQLSATFTILQSANGYLRGYVTPHLPANDVHINISTTLSSTNVLSAVTLSANTAPIVVYGQYNQICATEDGASYTASTIPQLAKQGEDADMLENYKDLRFQELFFNNVNLFDNFLGSIVGTISSEQNSIGKKVNEKVTNFVDNTANIEKCELPQLVSLLQSVDEQNIEFEKANFNYPVAIKRLVDLLSIKHSKLFGSNNTFDLDFYNYGNLLDGVNLGDRIANTQTYVLTAGTDIVALERYSGKFKKLDSYIPLSATSLSSSDSTYPLSSYNTDWGWYLILNNNFEPTDLDKYYTFFEFAPAAGDIHESVVNFADGNTTLAHTASSYTDWIRTNGYIDAMLNYQISHGAGLVDNIKNFSSCAVELSAPVATTYPVISTGSIYIATSASWNLLIAEEYNWYVNGAVQPAYTDKGVYTPTLTNGDTIVLQVSATNPHGATIIESNTITKVDAPPVLVQAPVITNYSAVTSSTVSTSAVWSDADSVSGQWYYGNTSLNSHDPVAPNYWNYTGPAPGITDSIFYSSSAENADGIVVSNSNTVNGVIFVLTPSGSYTISNWDVSNSTYPVASATWLGTDTSILPLSVQWYKNDAEEAGQTGAVYTGTATDTDTLYMIVSGRNLGNIAKSTSNTITVSAIQFDTLTVPSANVDDDLSGFTVMVDMADLTDNVWNSIEADGANIRVTTASDVDIPTDVVWADADAQQGRIYFRANLSASTDNVFKINSEPGLSALAVTDPNGRNAVWADYSTALVGPYATDRTGTYGTGLSAGTVGELYSYPYTSVDISPNVSNAHQGVAWGLDHYFVFDTNAIYKYDESWSLVTSNTDPIGDLITGGYAVSPSIDHIGDGTVIDGEVYVPVEEYPNTPYDTQYLVVFDAYALSAKRVVDISAGARESSSVCEGPNGHLYVTDFTAGSSIPYYNKTTGALEGTMTLSQTLNQVQGITTQSGKFYVSDDTLDGIWEVETDGTVNRIAYRDFDISSGSFEGVSTKNGNLLVLADGATSNVHILEYNNWFRVRPSACLFVEDMTTPDDWTSTTHYLTYTDNVQMNVLAMADANTVSVPRMGLLFDKTPDRIANWSSTGSWMAPTSVVEPFNHIKYHMAFASDSVTASRRVFIGGAKNAEIVGGVAKIPTTANTDFTAGIAIATQPTYDPCDGIIEYATVRPDYVSEDWAAAEGLNHRLPSTFYTVS